MRYLHTYIKLRILYTLLNVKECQKTAVPHHMHMKSSVFQHIFNYIFIYTYAFVALSIYCIILVVLALNTMEML